MSMIYRVRSIGNLNLLKEIEFSRLSIEISFRLNIYIYMYFFHNKISVKELININHLLCARECIILSLYEDIK